MTLKTRDEIRAATRRCRRAPREPLHLTATYQHQPELADEIGFTPVELTVEPTNEEGELAWWLDDGWWAEVIQRWADCPVTVRLGPTPGALLHPVILHQLVMVRRVAPSWRVIGLAYADDLTTDDDMTELARSPYHEVRVIDVSRPDRPAAERRTGTLDLSELFGRIRQEQTRLGVSTPILVRLPSSTDPPH